MRVWWEPYKKETSQLKKEITRWTQILFLKFKANMIEMELTFLPLWNSKPKSKSFTMTRTILYQTMKDLIRSFILSTNSPRKSLQKKTKLRIRMKKKSKSHFWERKLMTSKKFGYDLNLQKTNLWIKLRITLMRGKSVWKLLNDGQDIRIW